MHARVIMGSDESLRRRGRLRDAADHDAIREHVVIVLAPFA